jgi:haloacetate dehalogenase
MVNFPTRRNILKRLAAASIGTLIPTPWINILNAQTIPKSKSKHMPNTEFESSHIEIGGNNIYFRRYGKGPAILMVHGFPRTSLMWRHLAPKFAADHTVICVDLRAYGQSGIPRSSADHFPYSKRAMAAELVGVMEKLGFAKFDDRSLDNA